jgi:hypothetical protein
MGHVAHPTSSASRPVFGLRCHQAHIISLNCWGFALARNCPDLVVQKSGMPTQLIDRCSQVLNRRVVKSAYYLHKMFKRFCL